MKDHKNPKTDRRSCTCGKGKILRVVYNATESMAGTKGKNCRHTAWLASKDGHPRKKIRREEIQKAKIGKLRTKLIEQKRKEAENGSPKDGTRLPMPSGEEKTKKRKILGSRSADPAGGSCCAPRQFCDSGDAKKEPGVGDIQEARRTRNLEVH